MPSQIRFADRFRYWLDNQFSKGSGVLILWLAILSSIIILVAGVVLTLFQITPEGTDSIEFSEAVWQSLMRTLDAGTMGGDAGWGFRGVQFLVTLGGVFVISTLIGILSNAINNRLEDLRKGRSRVIERNHTVILGWSEQVFTILTELAVANTNQHHPCVVVLGNEDKVVMDDQIQLKADHLGKTRVVCRTGSPLEIADLELASLNTARAIIVPSPDSDDADSEVIKTILAITNHPNRRKELYHIVAEIRDAKNFEVAQVLGKGEVEWVKVGDFVARVIAQTCRQSGLSTVYTELLDFGGDEIYLYKEPVLVGKPFGEALLCYEKNTVMGILSAGGAATLNPPMNTPIQASDELIIIAADDDQIFYKGVQFAAVQTADITTTTRPRPQPETTLIIGWNWRAPAIITELDHYVAPGSALAVVAQVDGLEERLNDIRPLLKAQTLTGQEADTTDRQELNQLQIEKYDHIILLSYSDELAPQQADSRTLITLLHLRDIADRLGGRFSVVSEMLDVRNRNLAEVTRADDFIVSDKLVSLMLAQLAENKRLSSVFADLFDPEGSEIYLKPASLYIQTGKPVNFYTVTEAARRRGETALGYRLTGQSHQANQAYGVTLNPVKSDLVTFSEADKIIVLAE